jgi:tyrosyl-tRNA synthetase
MVRLMGLYNELEWRDLVYDSTEGLPETIEGVSMTAYNGFDATGPSLHVGHLLPVVSLARLQRFGHTPIALVGGGTGLIGDPSGKTMERQLLTFEQVEQNAQSIRAQLTRFLDFDGSHPAQLVNNLEWLRPLALLDFLRDVGKHFTVNSMMAKDSVKRRLGGEEGISFTEFSYQLLQAYDYVVLHDRFKCNLQTGGSDQWGNITAGIDLVRKLRGGRAYGLVYPLITNAAGTKFGKTEAGAVWLDAQMTTPFRFFQFWLNTDDRDVVKYLKFFTWLDQKTIAALEQESATAPERRDAQRVLAREVTTMVHGASEAQNAERAAAVLFGSSLANATVAEILTVFDDVPSCELPRAELEGGIAIAGLLVIAGLASSKGEATRLIKQGGLYVNDQRMVDERGRVSLEHAIDGRVIVLRKGQRERRLVKVVG